MTKSQSKPLAKALHTVTVLVRLGQYLQATRPDCATPENALNAALEILGYGDMPYGGDKDGCKAAALSRMEADAAALAAARQEIANRRVA